jgi:hypothetical protein
MSSLPNVPAGWELIPDSSKLGALAFRNDIASSDIIGELIATQIPNLDASKITSGTLAAARIANNSITDAHISGLSATKLTGNLNIDRIADGAITNAKIGTGLDASKLTVGTLPVARIANNSITDAHISGLSATKLSGSLSMDRIADGAITNAKIGTGLDASKLTVGTLPAARIPANHLSISQINTLQTNLNSKVNTSLTINGKALSANLTLNTQDVLIPTVTQLPPTASTPIGAQVRMGGHIYLRVAP